MKSAIKGFYLFLTAVLIPNIALSFCGFYVGKSDTNLFNESSKVVMVHKDNKNVITMVNDYQGDVGEFAMVVPVPEVLLEGQIHITQNKIIDHLDGYSAPRLVEYFDNDPCQIMRYKNAAVASPTMLMEDGIGAASSKVLGVTVEAQYSVGEYDIIILSAKESNGLETWLKQNKYKIPEGASQVLESYIRQGMKFFVAKVNLKKFDKSGNVFLSPLQIAFESNKFMLPIRLGTVNSKGKQDLFIYALSSKGRVESSNYRTVQIPSNITLPIYIKKDFGNTYKAIYNTAARKR